MANVKQQLWDKLQDDIQDLSVTLQKLLRKGMEQGCITEEDIISEVDDMDAKIKMIEKFYELADKLSIKIVTIEETLEEDVKETHSGSKL